MYRQGDVLLRKIKKLPRKPRLTNTDILLHGEATGHAHRLVNGEIYGRSWSDRNNVMLYMKAEIGAKVVHEEHGTIELEPGFYEVIRQREYEPGTNTDRWVMD